MGWLRQCRSVRFQIPKGLKNDMIWGLLEKKFGGV